MVDVMRIKLLAAALVSVAVLGAGCSNKTDKAASAEMIEAKVPTITVDQVDKALASNECQPVDANGESTRKKMGVLPGAVLLTDSSDFKVSELPTDKSKPLVFYCANTQCGASHDAASKAITAGYTNVKVMPDGIAGWVKAGKKVSQI
ncbi:MAG: Rhodanese domain protein [Myxococcales bacterium]|nr:Rhodanese domain protein [Myxococcales bacterium]